jgi:polyhydroxyalkanoate synthesis regulator phasin
MGETNRPANGEAARERGSSLADYFRLAWSLALIKVSAAEDEALRVASRVGDLAGWGPEEVRRLAKVFTERLAAQRKEFERSLDEGIDRAVARLKVPRREEIDALWARLARVAERIEALAARRQGGKP